MKPANKRMLKREMLHMESAQTEVINAIAARKGYRGEEYAAMVVNTAESLSWLTIIPDDAPAYAERIMEHLRVSVMYLGLAIVASLYGEQMPKDEDDYADIPLWAQEFIADVQNLMKQHTRYMKLDTEGGEI